MSTGHGRVQRDLLELFRAQPKGTRIGTRELAILLRYHRESVYRALLRLEEEGLVERVYYVGDQLGPLRQRDWQMVPERWEAERAYRRAVVEALELLERVRRP